MNIDKKKITETLAKIPFRVFENNIYFRDHLGMISILNSRTVNTDHELRNRAELYFSYGVAEADKIISDRIKCEELQAAEGVKSIQEFIERMREIGYIEQYTAYIREWTEKNNIAPSICAMLE